MITFLAVGIHYLLCQPLKLDVFLWARRFSFFKKCGSKKLFQILRKNRIFCKICKNIGKFLVKQHHLWNNVCFDESDKVFGSGWWNPLILTKSFIFNNFYGLTFSFFFILRKQMKFRGLSILLSLLEEASVKISWGKVGNSVTKKTVQTRAQTTR